jgi:hypothetical protein
MKKRISYVKWDGVLLTLTEGGDYLLDSSESPWFREWIRRADSELATVNPDKLVEFVINRPDVKTKFEDEAFESHTDWMLFFDWMLAEYKKTV